jgi:hypothetical protein
MGRFRYRDLMDETRRDWVTILQYENTKGRPGPSWALQT